VSAIANLIDVEARDDLRSLRRALESRPKFYPVVQRACHALVRIEVGQGNDPDALARALKILKKRMANTGVWYEIKRRTEGYVKPSARRRVKSTRARRRAMKHARHVAQAGREGGARGPLTRLLLLTPHTARLALRGGPGRSRLALRSVLRYALRRREPADRLGRLLHRTPAVRGP
jgi:ribosomal protein S21